MSVSLATAAAATSQAKVQMAVAAKIAKMNAGAERAVADLLAASAENMKTLVSASGAGVGGQLDISI